VSRLSGLPIANASLYDGATALVEALNMAAGATGRQKMIVSTGVHPHWRQVARTFAAGTGHELVEVPLLDGRTQWESVDLADAAAIVASYPNYLGVLEDLAEAKRWGVEHDALFVVAADPVAAGVLKSAGEWGADVFVAEGQPFGTPLAFVGPTWGSSRAVVNKSGVYRGVSSARPWTRTTGVLSSRRCARVNRTSVARGRRRTSARIRPSWR